MERECLGRYVEPLIRFADPGTLDGVKSRLKPIMKLTNVTFRYDATSITSEAADAIMERYVKHWQTLLATSEGCRQSAIASAAE